MELHNCSLLYLIEFYTLGVEFVVIGGICSFFIEFKLFQLVAEEGGSFFSLRIFE